MDDSIATTPKPPYYAVIFTSIRTPEDAEGYAQTAGEMVRLASRQPGFLGVESARTADGFGITVSYWTDLESIRAWKENADHRTAQRLGMERWYRAYMTRIAQVDRAYGHDSDDALHAVGSTAGTAHQTGAETGGHPRP